MTSLSSEVNGPRSALRGRVSIWGDGGPDSYSRVSPDPLFNRGCGPVVSDVYRHLFIRGKCGHISLSLVGCTVALLGLMWEVVTVQRRVK